jgi:hypothetical protein
MRATDFSPIHRPLAVSCRVAMSNCLPGSAACDKESASLSQPEAPPNDSAKDAVSPHSPVAQALPPGKTTRLMMQSLQYGYIGTFFGVAVVVGYAMGSYLDRRFHTAPTFVTLGTLFGIAAAFRELFRLARRYQKELARDSQRDPKNDPPQP